MDLPPKFNKLIAELHPYSTFGENWLSTFCVMLLRNKPAGENFHAKSYLLIATLSFPWFVFFKEHHRFWSWRMYYFLPNTPGCFTLKWIQTTFCEVCVCGKKRSWTLVVLCKWRRWNERGNVFSRRSTLTAILSLTHHHFVLCLGSRSV